MLQEIDEVWCAIGDMVETIVFVHATTAAERFFEAKHSDLFTHLVGQMPQLARSVRARSRQPYRVAERAVA